MLTDPDGLDDAVAITFDDGFANFAEHAAPLLLAHGLPAALFVVSDHVGGTNAWGGRSEAGIPTLPLLDWNVLGELAASGIEIGGHTRTHRPLEMLASNELTDEIIGGGDIIMARLGCFPAAFAYPYGSAPAGASTLVRARFTVGVTTRLGELSRSDDRALLPRLDAYYLRQPDGLDSWGSARFRAYLRLRAVARAARERVGGRRRHPSGSDSSIELDVAVGSP